MKGRMKREWREGRKEKEEKEGEKRRKKKRQRRGGWGGDQQDIYKETEYTLKWFMIPKMWITAKQSRHEQRLQVCFY